MKELVTAAIMAALLSGGAADDLPAARLASLAQSFTGKSIARSFGSGAPAFGWSGPAPTHSVHFGWSGPVPSESGRASW